MRITMVGAGGVGASYGARLARAGHDVRLLARGAHLDAIRSRGLTFVADGTALTLALPASEDAHALGESDVVVIGVKLWQTEEAAQAARPLVGDETLVVSLQNGVDARARIGPILGAQRVVHGVSQISAIVSEPGTVVQRSPFARIIVGEADGVSSVRLGRFVEACLGAGIEARESAEIEVELWAKFVFIASLSAACGMFRSPVGPILGDPDTAAFLERLIAEAVAVGRAEGVALPEDQIARTLAFTRGLPPGMRASMLDDLERGARLELPWLSGRVVAGGRRHGIETPAHETAEFALRLHADGRP